MWTPPGCSWSTPSNAPTNPEIQGWVRGICRYRVCAICGILAGVPRYVLTHHHEPEECAIAIAAWRGFDSSLRHGRPLGSCATGGHRVWWIVEALGAEEALALLPHYVARRTVAEEVKEVPLP